MRGDGAGEDVDEDWSSHDERVVGDVDGFDFPLPKGSFPGVIAPPESKSAPAQVPPRDGSALPGSLLLVFFLGQIASYRRRWASEAYQWPLKLRG